MKKSLNHYVAVYKDLLMQGDVQIAYRALRKYMLTLRRIFPTNYQASILSATYHRAIWIIPIFLSLMTICEASNSA